MQLQNCTQQGSKLRPIQSHLQLKFFRFATKASGEVANLGLIFTTALSKQKGYQLTIGLLRQKITRYKIRHAGGQAYYYSRTGTSKQRQVKQCPSDGNNHELALQHGRFCIKWLFVAKGLFAATLMR